MHQYGLTCLRQSQTAGCESTDGSSDESGYGKHRRKERGRENFLGLKKRAMETAIIMTEERVVKGNDRR